MQNREQCCRTELKDNTYVYGAYTQSFCEKCRILVPSKIVYEDDMVYILKNCKVHGQIKHLYEEDKNYQLSKHLYDKPATKPNEDTTINNGCPYDCGICPQHEQHACIGVLEITNKCDLNCKVCYATSGVGGHLTLEQIEEMMKYAMEQENNNAEILQISGGEPTTHPQIIEIIKMAKEIGFKYVMLNTNGINLAQDEDLAQQLSQFSSGFEVYLQFDGLDDKVYQALRGKNILDIKYKAIENLTKYKVPTTLVCTVAKGINDDQVGQILTYAMDKEYVRGVNFQPIAFFGRLDDVDINQRVTLSGVLKRIEKQTNKMIEMQDFIPLPCNVDRVAISYLLKDKKGFTPITRNENFSQYAPYINNTFMFTVEDVLKEAKDSLESITACKCLDFIKDFKKFIPKNFINKTKEERVDFVNNNTFRISVSSFLDMYNFDIKSMQKECVHIITRDLKRIPFSAYNMIYRGDGK